MSKEAKRRADPASTAYDLTKKFAQSLHYSLLALAPALARHFRVTFEWSTAPQEIAPSVFRSEYACKHTYDEPSHAELEALLNIRFTVRGTVTYNGNTKELRATAQPSFSIAEVRTENMHLPPLEFAGDALEIVATLPASISNLAEALAKQLVSHPTLNSLLNLVRPLQETLKPHEIPELYNFGTELRDSAQWNEVKNHYTVKCGDDFLVWDSVSASFVGSRRQALSAVQVEIQGFYARREDKKFDLFAEPNLVLRIVFELERIAVSPRVASKSGRVELFVEFFYIIPRVYITLQDVGSDGRVTRQRKMVVSPDMRTQITPIRSAVVVRMIVLPDQRHGTVLRRALAQALLQFLQQNADWLPKLVQMLWEVMSGNADYND